LFWYVYQPINRDQNYRF